ncbi:hypothetical protein TMatcc_006273 [Talaromyces marneffei ATCC 18224]|uniref:uncharacterized protein n=1 Tax=Talaromyces marneffei TaxID=37727 RepID=UPI0012AAB197|nr:uncharacterized protein EYB26_002773 [Talaromyces marneffei]KAE8554222.1 hypothetical protein EYB25_002760 [Talaromyces marneffei]QGA15117.1 hypothetical protein EYB26_002773 [Talaromyces marneffei]
MPNLSDLPYEIRFLIWEAVFHQPRNVYINMGEYPIQTAVEPRGYYCNYNENTVYFCSNPAPVLLHICQETRTFALARYEVLFGHARYPTPHLQPARGVLADLGFLSAANKDKDITAMTVYVNGAEDARQCPMIYFNYERDTVVFGRRLRRHASPTTTISNSNNSEEKSRAYFPLSNEFDGSNKMQAKIRNMAVNIDIASSVLVFLNFSPGSERFANLRNLYLYIESEDPKYRPRRVVELVDLTTEDKGQEAEAEDEKDGRANMAQRLLERFKTVFGRRGVTVDGCSAEETLRIIGKGGLSFWRYNRLRESLLENGGSPDELLKCVWLREVDILQSC